MAYYIFIIKSLKIKNFTFLILKEVLKHYNILKIIVNNRKTLFILNF